MSVEWVPLGDVLEMRRTSTNVDPGATYRPVGVRAFGRGIFDYPPTKGADLSKVRYFDLPAASLVVSNIKGWEGAVAVTGSTEVGRIASSRFLTYQPKADVDTSYVRHWLLSDGGMEVLDRCSPGSADRNRTLSRKGLDASLVPIVTMDEQRRIAAHLDRLARAPRPPAVLPRQAIRGVLGTLDWNRRAGDHLTFDPSELRVAADTAYRAMGVFGHARGVIDRGHFMGADTKYSTMYAAEAGQVIFSRLKAFEGAVAVVPDEMEGALVSKEFPLFTPHPQVDVDFLDAVISAPRFVDSMASKSTGIGARRERLSTEQFLTLPFPVTTVAQQVRIGAMQRLVRAVESTDGRRRRVGSALLPAARNEIFTAMR